MKNARFFAECLVLEGFTLEYGGTDTHMLLVDLKKFPIEGETFLDGEIASRRVSEKKPESVPSGSSAFDLPLLNQPDVVIVRIGYQDVHTVQTDSVGRVEPRG